MSKPKSRVRSVFDTVERAVGAPLERVATSYKFVDVMAIGIKTKRAVGGMAGRLLGGVLHRVNIATGDDVQRLNGQLASLAGEVRSIEPAPSSSSTVSKSAAKAPTAKPAKTKTARSKTARSKTARSKTAAARPAKSVATKSTRSPRAKSSTKSASTRRADG